jgi:hypothetical protein
MESILQSGQQRTTTSTNFLHLIHFTNLLSKYVSSQEESYHSALAPKHPTNSLIGTAINHSSPQHQRVTTPLLLLTGLVNFSKLSVLVGALINTCLGAHAQAAARGLR